MAKKMITLKVEERLLKDVDATVKSKGYSSRTDFITDSMRKNLDITQTAEYKRLAKLKGSVKGTFSWKKYRQIREDVSKQILREHGLTEDPQDERGELSQRAPGSVDHA